MIRAVLFDLDETLISHAGQIRAFSAAQYNCFKELKEIPKQVWVERLIELEQNGYVTKDIVYPQMVQEFGIEHSTATTLYQHFLETFHEHVTPLPYMNEILAYLRKCRLKIGIITNGGHTIQKRKIVQLGLENLVDVILISEQEGLEKPNPELFLRATQRLNLFPEHCLFVGDHQINDVGGAQSVGMTTVWVKNNKEWMQDRFVPDHVIEHLVEIEKLPLLHPQKNTDNPLR